MESEGVEGCSCWQEESGELSAVLEEVFSWLSGEELTACGAVCGAWRGAASDPRLWRRLLRRAGVAERTLRALREHCPTVSWRQEYVNACARWKLSARLPGTLGGEGHEQQHGAALLTHAALDATGSRLAIAADDGTFSIWDQANGSWQEEWSTDLRARGWTGAVRSEWAGEGKWGEVSQRLLVTGALALADRWELLVLQRDEDGSYRCMARAGCSAGAGGCWAGEGGFLSLELCRLAPRLAITVVWLNAATQETQSEYAGVTSPLLRIFNEEHVHLTHVLVADVPLEALKTASSGEAERDCYSPGASYYCASAGMTTSRQIVAESVQTLVTASQGAGGALRAWGVCARRPPPLCARDTGDLALRVRRRRAAPAPAPVPDDPDEPTVRAMCDPPDAECYLHTAVLGLVLHPSARCMWVSTADGGAWCVSLPELTRLCVLPGGAASGDTYYMQPAVSAQYVATPGGGRRAVVRVWSSTTGASCPRPPPLPPAAGPALVCLLPPHRDELLVLAGHSIHRPPCTHMRVCSRGERSAPVGSPPCAGPPPPHVCECPPQPRPACRARPRERVEALKVTCCPPEPAPCPPCLSKQPLTCSTRKLSSRGPNSSPDPTKSCIPNEPVDRCGAVCGNENDRVERRLAAEEQVRREHYEQDVCERKQRPCDQPPPASYCLGLERECARASDGRQYAVLCGQRVPVPECGPGRRPPPPQCVELIADDACKIQGAPHMDPCAHRRRTIVQIDRSRTPATATPTSANMKGDNDPGVTVSKQPCDKKCDEKSCQIKRSKPAVPPPCKLPTVTETLRERGPGPCSYDQSRPPQARSLHTSARNTKKNLGNNFKTRKNQFSTSKLISSSSPYVKIITNNRATSPLIKRMSANSCGGNVKSGSWASFEKLRKICQGFGSGKKNEKNLNMSSSCKMPPPCGPPKDTAKPKAQRVPPNPCAPKPSKSKNQKQPTSPCASKKSPTSPCAQKSSTSPCAQKSSTSPCTQKTSTSSCAQKSSTGPCAQKKESKNKSDSKQPSPSKSSSPCQQCQTSPKR